MATATVEKKAPSEGKLKKFFKGVWRELKKVRWPYKKQVINYTIIVVVTVVIFALLLSVLDTVLSFLLGLIIK